MMQLAGTRLEMSVASQAGQNHSLKVLSLGEASQLPSLLHGAAKLKKVKSSGERLGKHKPALQVSMGEPRRSSKEKMNGKRQRLSAAVASVLLPKKIPELPKAMQKCLQEHLIKLI